MRCVTRNAFVDAWCIKDATHLFEIDEDARHIHLGNGAHFYIISYDDYVVLKPDGCYYYFTNESFHDSYEMVENV